MKKTQYLRGALIHQGSRAQYLRGALIYQGSRAQYLRRTLIHQGSRAKAIIRATSINQGSTVLAAMLAIAVLFLAAGNALGTPANRISLERHFGRLLAHRLDNCATCHQSSTPPSKVIDLKSFPHNLFGDRLRILGEQLRAANKKSDIPTRLQMIAKEDSDGDGVDNLTEILLGHNPGDRNDKPTPKELADAPRLKLDYAKLMASYRWQPFETVHRPTVPKVKNAAWCRNPIDNFVAAERDARGLKPRPEASRTVLLRRVYLDLTGLAPTPDELHAFVADNSPNAYGKVVDRLLASPRYGERWGRHWMDVWRYSDWAGWGDQVRDSKPFIWRWRDWIVESLNKDKGYDRMVQEMLAADELCPGDTDALRATGFLVRNYKLLSREQWMEDVVGHTGRAFLGVTMQCAKCHDHMYDPVTETEYFRMRAIFEPHNVRTIHVPGQPDLTKDGLVHAYDADLKATTYFYPRGDERNPDKTRPMEPGVPACLGGKLDIQPVKLPITAVHPERRDFEVKEAIAAADQAAEAARKALADAQKDEKTADKRSRAKVALRVAMARRDALRAVIKAETLEDEGKKDSEEWMRAAEAATQAQRETAAFEAELGLCNLKLQIDDLQAKAGPSAPSKKENKEIDGLFKKLDEVTKAADKARNELVAPPSTAYKPRVDYTYPVESSGRRLAFAKWLTDTQNPLTARVAINHIWMRHFGVGLVPNAADFGRNSKEATNPRLADYLASELMASGWKMKSLHRQIVMSSTYRMDSQPDPAMAKIDPDNVYLWRMNSRRLEAEAVRDNVLWVTGGLDETMGGPEIDHKLGLTSRRRSIYLRIAAEKDVEFLKIFDGANVTECYERKPTVMPQQALALANSDLVLQRSKEMCRTLEKETGGDPGRFIEAAYLYVLSRAPTPAERKLCEEFLNRPATKTQIASSGSTVPTTAARARQDLLLVLLNHNDFVTVR